jgi:hypothetical protein
LRVLQAAAPNLFGDYTLIGQPDGTVAVSTSFRKV